VSAIIIDSTSGGPRDNRGEPFLYHFTVVMTALVFSGFTVNAVVNFDEFERFTPWIALHGLLSAAWYLLLIIQLRLVRAGKLATHRRLGLLSVLLALAFVGSGVILALDLFGFIVTSDNIDLASPQARLELAPGIGGIFLQFVLFSALYCFGLLNRKNPTQHKRFMVATSIQIAPAAFSRWLVVLGLPEMLTLLIMFACYLVMMIYDWRRDRKVHWATLTSFGIFLLLPIGFLVVFQQQWWADWLVGVLTGGQYAV
jgi:uncharacterized membrane protein YozB (DUF420 family)